MNRSPIFTSWVGPTLVGAVLVACALFGGYVVHLYDAKALQTAQDEARAAQARASALSTANDALLASAAVRERERVRVTNQAKEARRALADALARNRAWADQPVPDDVASVLVRPAGTASASP
ncbi:Rz-like spanin [Ralstonia phage phiAp1]|uniref:I-spanin n=1 Tax=Ralstonia phage phiAp1 TaxID=2783867 RepID=A0A1L7DSB1_9CAUD|nr:Rz-like spanin [Ralstonia phage phiAp1]APU03193.1 i-spanin [Ralstonia phage phiAp1]